MVAENCCYGVDRNPMAVEMAKLSMWLTTVARNRPFTFLDHAIKSGDSLLGITDLDQLRHLHLDVTAGNNRPTPIPGFKTGGDAVASVDRLVDEAIEMRREMHTIETVAIADVARKKDLLDRSEVRLSALAVIADVLSGAALCTAGERDPVWALTDLLEADAPLVVEMVAALGTSEQAAALDSARARAHTRQDAGRPDSAPPREPLHWPIAFPEVFNNTRAPGFDAMVGNPPFLGGQRITGAVGTDYRNHLIAWIADGGKGSADLVAYFFLIATKVARSFGFLATNTIAQGDTSEVGLTQIIDNRWTVHRAIPSIAWPGDTTLEIAKVWATSAPWRGHCLLDGRPVTGIDEMLYPLSRSKWRKERLATNRDKSFQGSTVLGTEGFTMSPKEAQALIDKDPNNADVLRPYLGGEDLNQSPTHTAPRWIINFFDWPEEKAHLYPDCFSIVQAKVWPSREKRKGAAARFWWRYWRPAPNLYRAIEPLDRVLVIALTSKAVQPCFVPAKQVFAHSLGVFAYDGNFHFGVFTSGFHYRWAVRHGSTLETRVRYTPSDVSETFPQPPHSTEVESVGKALDERRSRLMIKRDLGLTSVYNLVHDPDVRNDDAIRHLRRLHASLDVAVCDAYGWSDLDLGHGFHDVRGQGVRFTFSPSAADEVLDRLLELNRERYDTEVAAGLHQQRRKPRKAKAARSSNMNQGTLLGDSR